MISVEVNGSLLDMSGDAALSYVLNNTVLTSTDNQLPGSYTFPFEVLATPRNQAILGHPGIINRATALTDKEATIYFQGQRLFTGLLGFEAANDKRISIYIVASAVRDLKQIKLTELDLGGVREIGTSSMLAHAKLTAQNPLSWPYVFYPVLNRKFITALPKTYVQNQWNASTESFVVSADNPAIMPFIRVEYLIAQIMASTGYDFRNEFQVDDELRNLTLYNNYSIYSNVEIGIQSYIRLNDHVPDITCADFLKRISAVFCLGLFTDTFNKQIRLIPLQRILETETQIDWTDKAHQEYSISLQKTEIPEGFNYTLEGGDDMFELLAKLQKPETFTTIQNVDDMGGEPAGFYYVIAAGEFWENIPTGRSHWVYADFGYVPNRDGKPRIEPSIPPVFDLHDYLNTPNYTNTQLPVVDVPGTVTYDEDTGSGTNFVTQRTPVPVRMAIYRGFTSDGQAVEYPLGSGIRYGPLGQVLGQYSLRWDGPDGIYAKWWAKWHYMLQGKQVSRKVNLTTRDLTNFSFAEKVRIDNMDYFIKSIRVNLTMRGIAPCDVSMVSVV